jgi:WD40 repeat protein
MRLLPRSAKGTWLLAAAAWAAGCVVLWQIIPPVPRAVINFPGTKWFIDIGPGGRTVTFLCGASATDRGGILVWDIETGTVRAAGDKEINAPIDPSSDGTPIAPVPLDPDAILESVSPDGRTALVTAKQFSLTGAVREWLGRWGLSVSPTWNDTQYVLLDATTGRRLMSLPPCGSMFAPDSKSFAHFSPGSDQIELWDISPPKSLFWFALAATILALPLAGLAWRRSRRLRRGAA